MKANKNYGEGVVSYDIFEISNAEMDQMIEVRNRVGEVIANHMTVVMELVHTTSFIHVFVGKTKA